MNKFHISGNPEGAVSGTMRKRKKPLQNRSRERVERIVAATRDLLALGDDLDITTSTIAKKAEVPVGSVYQYFEDRDDILLAVAEIIIEEHDQKLRDVFKESSRHAHWRQIVKVLLNAYVNVVMEDKVYLKLSHALAGHENWASINRQSSDQMVHFLSSYGLFQEKGLTEAESRNMIRIIVIMVVAVVRQASELSSKVEADRLLGELPKMTIAYLATILGD